MEYERVRRSVSGFRPGGPDGAAVRRAGQDGPETKGELVSRRLRQLGLSRTIVDKLVVREIGRSGRAESTPSSEQANAAASSAAVRASASAGSPRASLLGARSLSLPSIGTPGSFAPPPAISGRSGVIGEVQTPLGSVSGYGGGGGGVAAADAVVERARRRYAERKQLKHKLLADLQALRESEAEQERAKAEALREQLECERAERASKLAQWKEAEQAKEERKKLKEERRREKERRALEEGRRARQSKYLAQLKEVEAAARHKQERAAAEAALAAQCEAARPPHRDEDDEPRSNSGEGSGKRRSRPLRNRSKARMGEIRSQYDPAGKLVLPKARGALKGSTPAAKNMTDDEIIEMARRIVSESDQARDPVAQLNQREQDEEEQHRLLEQALRSPAGSFPPAGPLAAYELGSAFDLPESSLPDPLVTSSSRAYLSPGYADGRAAAFNYAAYSSSSLKTPPATRFSPVRGGGPEPSACFSPARLSPVRHALQEPTSRADGNYRALSNEPVAQRADAGTDIAAWYREQMRSVDDL